MTEDRVDKLAKKLWNYGLMHHQPEKADAIVVFGSYNPVVGVRAAELYLQGYAPIIVFSGNRSDGTSGWEKTEAETLADVAIDAGVPKDKILLEKKGIKVSKIIIIQKPYAERRAYATVTKQWPGIEVIMASPQLSYEEYMATAPNGRDNSITTMVGDVQRIKVYAEKGFQTPQKIPADVWAAFEELANIGYGTSLS